MLERKLALTTVFGLLVLLGWYVYASDYSYRAISGKYVYKHGAERYTLRLSENETFTEEVQSATGKQYRSGTWTRIGEGGVIFSNTLLLPFTPAKPLKDGEIYGEALKSYTLRPSIHLQDHDLMFYKTPF